MRLTMSIMLIALALLTSACAMKTKLYRITPVITAADKIACGQAGGHAGRIADLDKNGDLISGWIDGCILAVK